MKRKNTADMNFVFGALSSFSNEQLELIKRRCIKIITLNQLDRKRDDVAIVHAARKNKLEFIKMLFEDGVRLNTQDDMQFGNTALHAACSSGHLRIVEYLLENGASTDIPNEGGYTPLFYSICSNNRHCIPPLLMNHADGSFRINKYIKTPFEFAMGANSNADDYITVTPAFPFGVKEIWENMALQMWKPTRDRILQCATIVSSSHSKKTEGFFPGFFHEVHEALHLMAGIMSFFDTSVEFGPDLNPRFMNIQSKVYRSFATDVLRAFNATSERKKPLGFFVPFINEGRKNPFSLEWITDMMKVLVIDSHFCFGRVLVEPGVYGYESDIKLHLGSLEFDAEKDVVSLAEEMDLYMYE